MDRTIHTKRKRILLVSIFAFVAVLILWGIAFYQTNHLPYQIPDRIYELGESVPLGSNYFIEPDEDPNGYCVQVNRATLLTYQQLFEQYKLDSHSNSGLDEYGNAKSNYVYDVELTISNENNTNGYILFGRFLLIDKSLSLIFDGFLQSPVYPDLEDVGSLKLSPGTTKTLHFFFTPSTGAFQKSPGKVDSMMENGQFSLCVSEFPTRILIRLSNVS